MVKAATTLLAAGVIAMTSGPLHAEYCGGSRFHDAHSDRLQDGDFDIGYTSGYFITTYGTTYLRRCITNFNRWSSVSFVWNGPRPDPLFEGRVARATRDTGRASVEKWQTTVTGAERDDRVLSLSITPDGNFDDYDIETFFERADLGTPQVHLAQDLPGLDISSGRALFEDFGRILEDVSIPIVMSSGVGFSFPYNQDAWEAYLNGGDDGGPDQGLGPMQFATRLIYDRETFDITLEVEMAYDLRFFNSGLMFEVAQAFSVEVADFETFDGADAQTIFFEYDPGNLDPENVVNGGLLAIRQTVPLGNFDGLVDSDLPPFIENVPVTIHFLETELFRFYLQAFGEAQTF